MSKGKIIFGSLLVLVFGWYNGNCRQVELPSELQSPQTVQLNRMPMKAESFGYENRALATKGEREASAYFLSLNGTWKFNWVQDPRKRPVDFYRLDYSDASWKDFPVPANWELNGYGLPIYVNHPYEFTGRKKTGALLDLPYDIPVDNNPVGSYRKRFTVPGSWDGRQVFIHLGAVKSAFFVWVNGRKVGYSEDSKLAAEFDITRFLVQGENLVALQVYRWSDGSYLECQDMWRISGIERDVFLYAVPKLDIRDFKAVSGLDDSYTSGLLSVSAEINSYKLEKGTGHSVADTFSVALELVDRSGKSIYATKKSGSVLGNYNSVLSFSAKIGHVDLWSAEVPNLYTLFITLSDSRGRVLQVVPQRIGFKRVEIRGDNLLVNGKRIFLKGVNRHEHNAKAGHVLSRGDMLKDIRMMKRLNINAVRNSHYPPDPYWMSLCDEYGLYVVDEANIESHGRYYELAYSLGNDRGWTVAHLERISRMYERDKNHPSVIIWSLGNEAGNGVNFYEGYKWLKAHDDRPVQYERAEHDFNTDLFVPQYPSPDFLGEYASMAPKKLLIMSEYAHIMGNSLGNFSDYWRVIESSPHLQGGFIWEWIDQGIDTVKNGKRIMAYGGDFPLSGPVDENFSDNNFCVKGVVTAYREMTPMAVEVKKVYQYIRTTYLMGNTIAVENGYFFKGLDNVSLFWELLEDGRVVQRGKVSSLAILPREKKQVLLPLQPKKAGREYLLNIYYRLINAEPLLEAGYAIAEEQLLLTAGGQLVRAVQEGSMSKISVSQNGNLRTINGKHFSVGFDMGTGTMENYSASGQLMMERGPVPSFWRAPTDNDIGAGLNGSLRIWRNAYLQGRLLSAEAKMLDGGTFQVSFEKELAGGDGNVVQRFRVHGDGSIDVQVEFHALKGKYPLLLRFGTDLEVNGKLSKVRYYGRGPGENYADRYSASMVGIYSQDVSSQYFPYARPQESGNKTAVRWAEMTDGRGRGLRFESSGNLLGFSALPYALDDLDPAQEKAQFHSGELVLRKNIYLHVDHSQSGVGGIDSWGATPMKKYCIPFSDMGYSYTIRPVGNK